jgi:hypothetical protein
MERDKLFPELIYDGGYLVNLKRGSIQNGKEAVGN